MEKVSKPIRGIWYWDEILKTLEFLSYSTTAHAKVKARKSKVIHFQESKSKDARSGSDDKQLLDTVNGASQSRTFLRTKSLEQAFSARKWDKPSHVLVTLDDVKNVALGFLEEGERKRMSIFSAAVTPERLDDFLMALLVCVSCYLERIDLDKKARPLMKDISLTEINAIKDVISRTETAKKFFAHMYCRLILAVGIPEKHQIACGRSNASAIQNDWRFLERLNNFSVTVAWIAFRQKDLLLIQEEVSSLLHSESLNPTMKRKDGLEEQQSKTSFAKQNSNRMQRRASYKRFAKNDTICQRSPTLICLMPLPKEKADYLFRQHPPNPRSSYGTAGSCNWIDLEPAVFPTIVGIIGEPRKQFDPLTLAPLPDEDDEIESTTKKVGPHFDLQGIETICPTDHRDSVIQPDERHSLIPSDNTSSLSHTTTLISKDTTSTGSYP